MSRLATLKYENLYLKARSAHWLDICSAKPNRLAEKSPAVWLEQGRNNNGLLESNRLSQARRAEAEAEARRRLVTTTSCNTAATTTTATTTTVMSDDDADSLG